MQRPGRRECPPPRASPRSSLTQCFAEKRAGMSARDPIPGAELDGVELPGTPSEATPIAPNSSSAGHDGELAPLLRAGGQVTAADLRDPPQKLQA